MGSSSLFSRHSLVATFLGAAISISATFCSAATLFESGTLGPTGITWTELVNQSVPATNIKDVVFSGVRFELAKQVMTTEIGGHFASESGGTFFGAIVSLDNENDFPDSNDLSSADVQGTTLISFPTPSDEVFGTLNLLLEPGWYAAVFGSGLFGATANGGALRNGADIRDPVYVAFQPGAVGNWSNLTSLFDNHRFVVRGQIVPEPSSLFLSLVAFQIFVVRRFSCQSSIRNGTS